MAEYLFWEMISRDSLTDTDEWQVASAGTWAMDGQRAARNTREVLSERGIDAREHRSQVITSALIEEYNLVLVMENSHKEALRAEFPEQASKVYLLSEMTDEARDVYDPIGGPLVDFSDMATEIEKYLRNGLERIKTLAKEQSA